MIRTLLAATAFILLPGALAWDAATAQTAACPHRGALDDAYCDEDRDLVADTPRDASRLRNPSTLVFAYTPVEDPALYASQFRPLLDYLTGCTGKRVVYFQVTSNAAQVEAMRSGRLHIAGFSTGPTAFAVNLAGAVPFAIKGNAREFESYRVLLITRADGNIRTPADLARAPGGPYLGHFEFGQPGAARSAASRGRHTGHGLPRCVLRRA
jgi:phosphonate transport system substrate-binding protein